MKFRNPNTGEVFDNIREAREAYCTFIGSCFICKIPKQGCAEYCLEHPQEAAELMGYEVVKEERSCPRTYCEDRATTLLKACLDLFERQENSFYVLDVTHEPVFYDGGEYDGTCLANDIREYLGMEE